MAEVLSVPVQVDGASYFSSRLRRSPSSTSFLSGSPDSYSRLPRLHHHSHNDYSDRLSVSAPSSAPTSPRLLHTDISESTSYSSTPASCLSLDTGCPEEDDQIIFPSYDDAGCLDEVVQPDTPASPSSNNTEVPPSISQTSSRSVHARPQSPELMLTAEDDTAVRIVPSRHVDYLSHDWREEDIWSSWRHIVSRRKIYGNSARLENASWRTWAKSKYRLRTVSPERLNWYVLGFLVLLHSRTLAVRGGCSSVTRLKDCDVTWLYGPLQNHCNKGFLPCDTPGGSRLSKTNSFLNKKPILKKRSMSEIMLQRSISASSLLKQAAAAVQAQQSDVLQSPISERPNLDRATSDFVTSTFASESGSADSSSAFPSASSSGLQTPGTGERRHIHFNDKVEQCIAVDIKDGEDEEDDTMNPIGDDDDDSDDGVVMMRVSSKARIRPRPTPRNSFSSENKTIAMLPSTTLKYREDSPRPEEGESEPGSRLRSTRLLSPSPSQETLRPSKPSSNFLLDDDDDDADMSWEPSEAVSRRAEASSSEPPRLQGSLEGNDEEEEHSGLRRTASGMFMPYEEDEDDAVAAGLFGRVVDTVNTARDIAHVIWNVGWRR